MAFRGSSGTSHKTKKLKGRRTASRFKTVGKTWVCPKCRNVNSTPLVNADNKPYCSACLVKYSEVVIMKARKIIAPK